MKQAIFVGMLAIAAYAGCGNDDSGSPAGGSGGTDGGTAGTGGSSGSGASGEGAGDSGTGCASDCDDGFNCTIDSCVAGKCTHAIGPNTGETACPAGQYCTVEQGCIAAPACADVSDCEKAFEGDACKSNIRCDPASSICLFDILDKDHDNHPPQVCGGADCNDDDPVIHPGAVETCDGEDQDCDGTVDDGATCADSLQSCQSGACACKPENLCGAKCVDKQTDGDNCGACGNKCDQGYACESGSCICPDGSEVCDGACVSLMFHRNNCGSCGHACNDLERCDCGVCKCSDEPDGQCSGGAGGGVIGGTWSIRCDGECIDPSADDMNCSSCGQACSTEEQCDNGSCECLAGFEDCSGECVDLMSDPNNCGYCSNNCAPYEVCDSGSCACQETCGGTYCVDLSSDSDNCGTCGHSCAPSETCQSGSCACLPGSLCSGVCVNLSSDESNCGTCGTTCPSGDTCEPRYLQWQCGGSVCAGNFNCCASWDNAYCAAHSPAH